jgi:hypothetical protein
MAFLCSKFTTLYDELALVNKVDESVKRLVLLYNFFFGTSVLDLNSACDHAHDLVFVTFRLLPQFVNLLVHV